MEAATAIREIINDDDLFEDHNEMTPDTFMEIVKLCLTTTCLQFCGEHYELTDGLAMGSPASPCIANIYMDKFERNALDTFNGPPPKTWWRYVDDVLSVMKRRAVDELLRHLNSQHPSIQFTHELEKDGSLPYLDLALQRSGQDLMTTVSRKPSHTGRYLHFTSNHPRSAMRSVVNSLFSRLEYVTKGGMAREHNG